jgi:hypothetical protein
MRPYNRRVRQNVTIYDHESIKGLTNRPGWIYADTRMMVLGKADGVATRDSRANMAAACLMSLEVQTCEGFHHIIT